MELGSKNSLASTYDNEDVIFKRILIFFNGTFDKINIFQESEASVV